MSVQEGAVLNAVRQNLEQLVEVPILSPKQQDQCEGDRVDVVRPVRTRRTKCDQFNCIVDCVMSRWSDLSKCSSADVRID